MSSEIFDWLCILFFIVVIGAVIVAAVIVAINFSETNRVNEEGFQQRVAVLNESYLDTMLKFGQQLNLYESSYQETQPYITTQNVTEFLSLCQKWNKTAILYDKFQQRRTGFLGLLINFNGYFWFTFDDNGVIVQARLEYAVDR